MKEIYLDNSATTRCSDEAANVMMKVLTEDFGNPSSLHNKGMLAENYLKNTRKIIADTLKVDKGEIYFTSGGSESNNTAILGYLAMNPKKGHHVITTSIEHASIEMPFQYLEENGYEVTRLSVDEYGNISLDELRDAVREDTALVSIMHVNNEIGTVEPIEEAAKIIHEKNPNTVFHVDAIQSYGKIPIYPERTGIDMLSVSGHKIHGPKGSGFLYIRDKVRVRPLVFGGGQEKLMRSGTENVPAIAGLGAAVSEIFEDIPGHLDEFVRLRKIFADGIKDLSGLSINGPGAAYTGAMAKAYDGKNINTEAAVNISASSAGVSREEAAASENISVSTNAPTKNKTENCGIVAPYIISLSVKNVRAEVLLHALEEKGIFVSAGSACSSNRTNVSRTLTAIHLPKNLLESTVRFSMSYHTTEDEILDAVKALHDIVPLLQRYTRH